MLDGHRILVAEDDYFLAQEIAEFLTDAHAHVLGPVPTPEAALALAQAQKPDAGILDIYLRDGTAYPIADLLMTGKVPFLFVTGYDCRTIPERYAGIRLFKKTLDFAGVLAALAAELQKESVATGVDRSYAVRRAGDVWQWEVKRFGVVAESGFESSHVRARVAAILAATKLLQ